jgi:hypothetical protein
MANKREEIKKINITLFAFLSSQEFGGKKLYYHHLYLKKRDAFTSDPNIHPKSQSKNLLD